MTVGPTSGVIPNNGAFGYTPQNPDVYDQTTLQNLGQGGSNSGPYVPTTVAGADIAAALDSLALQTWLAAFADRDNNPANIVALGHSITEGNHATAVSTRWQARVRDMLRSGPYAVSGVSAGGTPHFLPTYYQVPNLTAPCTVAGTLTKPATIGVGCRSSQLKVSGDKLTYTVTGTRIKVMDSTISGGGTYSVVIDGGAATNISTDVAGAQVDGRLSAAFDVSAGTHTVEIAWVSGTSTIDGIVVWNGDEIKGVRMYDAGRGGDRIQTYSSTANAVRNGFMKQWMATFNPHLVILEYVVNERINNQTPSSMQGYYQEVIASIRAAVTTNPSFLILVDYEITGSYTYTHQQYTDALQAIVAADTGGPSGASGVAILDLSKRMPISSNTALGLYYTSDQIHPLDKGHAMIADAVFRKITPR